MRDAPRFVHILSDEYVHAIGEVVVSWAFFEVDLDRAIHYMRMNPDAKALASSLPLSVKKRLKLFRDSVEAAFGSYPAALPRLRQIGNEASHLAAKRHQLAHARWAKQPDGTFTGYLVRDGNWGNHMKLVTNKDQIIAIGRRINEVHLDLEVTLHAGGPKNPDHFLKPDEIAAIRAFRTDNFPTPQTPLLP